MKRRFLFEINLTRPEGAKGYRYRSAIHQTDADGLMVYLVMATKARAAREDATEIFLRPWRPRP